MQKVAASSCKRPFLISGHCAKAFHISDGFLAANRKDKTNKATLNLGFYRGKQQITKIGLPLR